MLKQFWSYLLLVTSYLLIAQGHAVYSQTVEIGGDLTQNRVLFADTTYVITEDLRVSGGLLLEIEPGTVLKFRQGKGLVVDNGFLIANGDHSEGIDSVKFIPDHTNPAQSWKWKGIQVQNVSQPDQVVISYAFVGDAERGIEILNSANFSITHSCFVDNFWRGVSIINSHNIVFQNNDVLDNYVGLEIVARGVLGQSYQNQITGNTFSTETTGIFIINENSGKSFSNSINFNVIQAGINGVWLDNSGQAGSRSNSITNNAIINNGNGFGYGLYLAMDSTVVTQNIFWRNSTAVTFRNSSDNKLENNSFYENKNGLNIPLASRRNKIRNNTFTAQRSTVIIQGESTGNSLLSNNLFHNTTDTILQSTSSQNISVSGNYWGTQSEQEIQDLIIDVNDDPSLGEVYFLPFLEEADTTAPMSPPLLVKKQWVNSQVRLSWRPNEETDLYGYKVYFNDFKNYSFSQNLDLTTDTILFLPQLSIAEEIAVTATDHSLNGDAYRFLGHESPFAFAEPYPYAGNDTSICKNEAVLVIENAHNPFSPSAVVWSSNGDGEFSNPISLQTSYFPGFLDYENGSVLLTMRVLTAEREYIEKFRLSFDEDPVVFAGADTLIGRDSTILLQSAYAQYFDQLGWSSLGDGYFSDFTQQHPVYFPGEDDYSSGSVDLIIQASSECGIAADTITIFFKDVFSLSGKVWQGNIPYQNAKVLAKRIDNSGFSLLSATNSEITGDFVFTDLFEGSYVLQAIPDTNSNQLSAIYYAADLVWEQAHKIQLDAWTEDVDLRLNELSYSLPQGRNRIFGRFNLPEDGLTEASVYCNDWFDRNGQLQYCDGGLSNIVVHLFNPGLNAVLASTLTDAQGRFYFDELPYGSYRLYADLTGYPMITSEVIGFAPETPATAQVIFELIQKKISAAISYTDDVTSVSINSVTPNPVKNELLVRHNFSEITSLKIYDLTGQIVFEDPGKVKNLDNTVRLNVSGLINGIYLIVLQDANQSISLKFVKN